MAKLTFKKALFLDLNKRGLAHIIPHIKSVKTSSYSMGSSGDVYAFNLFKKDREALDAVVKSYQYGTFDSMTDCAGICEVETPVSYKHCFLNHEFTQDIKDIVIQKLAEQGITDDQSAQEKRFTWYGQLIFIELQRLEGV